MKKRLALVISLIMIGVRLFAQFETKLRDDLFLTKLSDTVYVVTHYFPWESNSLIVRASKDDIVLIDTPYDTSAAELLLNWVNTNMSPLKITAINTGFHIDNLGGNQYLREKGIDIYGSDKTCNLVEERGKQTQQQIISWLKPNQVQIRKVYENMLFVKPNKIFKIEEGLNLKIGNISFEVFFPGETHSPDNVVVFLPELNVLFGGCMVKSLSSANLGFTGDANLIEWPKSMKVILRKYEKAEIVIPHHGMWGNLSLIQHTIDLLEKKY